MLSGVSKLFGIHTFGQEVQLYADAYVGMLPHDYAWCVAVAVCVFELALGIFALSRRWALLTAVAFFVVVGFFCLSDRNEPVFPDHDGKHRVMWMLWRTDSFHSRFILCQESGFVGTGYLAAL